MFSKYVTMSFVHAESCSYLQYLENSEKHVYAFCMTFLVRYAEIVEYVLASAQLFRHFFDVYFFLFLL